MTFVITCYDLPADMLRECVTAIFSLAFQPGEREVIVIDDGSKLPAITDIDDVKDQIIYLRQPNSGLACARNMGIRVATGRYIQFVDGDDYLLRIPYEHCLDLVRYHNPDMVLFDFSTRSSVATPYSYEGPMSGSEYMQGHNLHGTACGYIFSRELLGSLRFTAGILHEDEEFTPQLILRAERLFYTDAKAYYYRQRRGSIMHVDAASHIDKRLSDSLAVILRLQQMAATTARLSPVASPSSRWTTSTIPSSLPTAASASTPPLPRSSSRDSIRCPTSVTPASIGCSAGSSSPRWDAACCYI